MEFLEAIIKHLDNGARFSATSPFSYFIETKKLKIHYVKIEHFNVHFYNAAKKLLNTNHEFYVTVFEDQFKIGPDKIIDRLKYQTGSSIRIHGRKTSIVKLNKLDAIDFLLKNHGNVALKTKYNFGLKNKSGSLVAIACFGQIIEMRSGAKSSELIRFCNLSGTHVVGGLTKLINHFQKTHLLEELMTYCDLEWSNGANYEKLGFKNIETTNPIKFIVNLSNWERKYAQNFKVIEDLALVKFDNFRSIENLGSIKFIKYFND